MHFFKIIEENSLRDGELRIPRSFVRKYWQEVSNPVLLLPNGAKWGVSWKKRDGDVWLSKGWRKFAGYYSLDEEHFLVFGYEGKSQFRVVILDRSALEIDYSLFKGTCHGEDSDENGKSWENFDGFSPCQSKRSKSPLPTSCKKMKTNPKEEPKCYPSPHVETKVSHSQRTKLEKGKFHADFDTAKPKNRGGRGSIYDSGKCLKSEAPKSEQPLEDTESSSALERAQAFRSKNPSFIREMHPSFIKKNILVIPGNFVTAYLEKKDGSATLWVSKERTWDVKFKMNSCSGQLTLTTGWKTFVRDNNLKLEDVCVFELTKRAGVSFRVVIFRARKESSPPLFEEHTN